MALLPPGWRPRAARSSSRHRDPVTLFPDSSAPQARRRVVFSRVSPIPPRRYCDGIEAGWSSPLQPASFVLIFPKDFRAKGFRGRAEARLESFRSRGDICAAGGVSCSALVRKPSATGEISKQGCAGPPTHPCLVFLIFRIISERRTAIFGNDPWGANQTCPKLRGRFKIITFQTISRKLFRRMSQDCCI